MPWSLDELIAATPELAAMPATSARLLDLLDEPDVGAAELVAVIEKDPGLTANLLKLCNSAYYGVARELGTVREALVMLGNRTVVTLAFAASMGRLLQAPVSGYRLPRGQLWRHALAVGLVAARLAPAEAATVERNRLFTAGLIHDLGKLLLDRPLRDSLEQLPANLDYSSLVVCERDLLGFDHAMAGAALAEAWNFPADLVEVIGHHHCPSPPGRPAALVMAADLLAADRGHHGGASRVLPEQRDLALQAAGLDPEGAIELGDLALRDLDGLLALLGAG
ncbi:MAG: HDOD domain-containing protein [Candidatus Krumholzibacteriia bacterium]